MPNMLFYYYCYHHYQPHRHFAIATDAADNNKIYTKTIDGNPPTKAGSQPAFVNVDVYLCEHSNKKEQNLNFLIISFIL